MPTNPAALKQIPWDFTAPKEGQFAVQYFMGRIDAMPDAADLELVQTKWCDSLGQAQDAFKEHLKVISVSDVHYPSVIQFLQSMADEDWRHL